MAVVLGTSLALVILGKGAFLLWPFLWHIVRLPLWLKALWLRADIVHNLPMLVDSFLFFCIQAIEPLKLVIVSAATGLLAAELQAPELKMRAAESRMQNAKKSKKSHRTVCVSQQVRNVIMEVLGIKQCFPLIPVVFWHNVSLAWTKVPSARRSAGCIIDPGMDNRFLCLP